MAHSAAARPPHAEERPTKNSFNAELGHMRDNPLGIWKFVDALRYWAPAIEHAEFCHRRRPGDVAGTTQRVVLATPSGSYPSTCPHEETLILRGWDSKWCFWTLDHSGKRFVVRSVGSRSKEGVYRVRWLGVTEGYDRQPVAWPIRVSLPSRNRQDDMELAHDQTPAQTSLAAHAPTDETSSDDEFYSAVEYLSDDNASSSDVEPDQGDPDTPSQKRARRLVSRSSIDRMAAEDAAEEDQAPGGASTHPGPSTPGPSATPPPPPPPPSPLLRYPSVTPSPAQAPRANGTHAALPIDEEDEHAAGLEGELLAEYKRKKDKYYRLLGDMLRKRQAE
ncbi:MAG: hypothetical protein L6R37_006652 [Teloschistes peruensis]|nr:MAG: hypothetical protein L6R37_006652 [Teloschistes peruensis]